ncbi:MAG TPA: group 1 truncated hemoglobin [Steroidobacteraceae bacterium]|jgi:hemoglobin|nr:group 1 truncated hemoglobin [Steroidobacteraceae bacterium]
MLRRQLRGPLLGLCVAGLLCSFAPSAQSDTLFEQIGGESVLKSAVDEFANIILDDSRINFAFAGTNMDIFRSRLYSQLCDLSGGGCKYSGRDMRTAHARLNVSSAQFNALAEDLYQAMDKVGVSYRVQNKLVALLAPMQQDIVKK